MHGVQGISLSGHADYSLSNEFYTKLFGAATDISNDGSDLMGHMSYWDTPPTYRIVLNKRTGRGGKKQTQDLVRFR